MSTKVISRAKGASAVASAAYRHGAKMHFELEDKTLNYTGKHEVVHTEIALPNDTPEWVRNAVDGRSEDGASEAIWNAVENFEKRMDAQLAREIEVALPVELTKEQNIELAREFAAHFTSRGMIADWAYHDLHTNPHIHMMLTLRPLSEDGFGPKRSAVLDANGEPVRFKTAGGERILYENWAGGKDDLKEWRALWAGLTNSALERAGSSARIDHRSHSERGLEVEPAAHLGVRAHGMLQRGAPSQRVDDLLALELRNIQRLRARPEAIIDALIDHKSTFTEQDVRTELGKYLTSDKEIQDLAQVALKVDTAIPLTDGLDGEIQFTTPAMIRLEQALIENAEKLHNAQGFRVSDRALNTAIAQLNEKLAGFGGSLGAEQIEAIEAVTSPNKLVNIIGYAGAGKSTLLEAARLGWEASGYKVHGVALAGKAARELQESSGIHSRTIASAQLFWQGGSEAIGKGDILVVDEAGMVGSKQLHGLLERARIGGAKVVLVGDPSQLPAISAGAAFRGVLERTSFTLVSQIRRQRSEWQLAASLAFAQGKVEEGLSAYKSNGGLKGSQSKAVAIKNAADGIVADIVAGKGVLGLAHTNDDIGALNAEIRSQLKELGTVGKDFKFRTANGERLFGAGDRVIFLKNHRDLGVTNGSIGTVELAGNGWLQVRLEGGNVATVQSNKYDTVDYGYAVTIHKSQGATVDSVHLVATRSMDRNLTYVGLTRHRDNATVYYSNGSFRDVKGGVIAGLAKRRDKTLTLDFEDEKLYKEAVRFGRRRGLLSERSAASWLLAKFSGLRENLLNAWSRLIGTRKDAGWLIPPEALSDKQILELAIHTSLEAGGEYKKLVNEHVGRAYADPAGIMAAIEKAVDGGQEATRDAIRKLRSQPELYGPLVSDRQGKRPAQKSLHEARQAAGALRRWEGARRSVLSTEIARLADGNLAGVRELSGDATSLLKAVGELSQTEPADSNVWGQLFADKQETAKEIQRWSSALVSRFGGRDKAISGLSQMSVIGGERALLLTQAINQIQTVTKLRPQLNAILKAPSQQIVP